jgi:hypothetical protein
MIYTYPWRGFFLSENGWVFKPNVNFPFSQSFMVGMSVEYPIYRTVHAV